MHIKVKKAIVSLALALSLAAQPLAIFPMNVFAVGPGDVGADEQGEAVYSVAIKNKSSIEPVFRGQQTTTKMVDAPEVDIDAQDGHYLIKWEVVSGNDSGVVANVNAETGQLTIDFDKMTNWAEVVEIKVTVADKIDSYKLAVINAEDIDAVLDEAARYVSEAANAANGHLFYDTAAVAHAVAYAAADSYLSHNTSPKSYVAYSADVKNYAAAKYAIKAENVDSGHRVLAIAKNSDLFHSVVDHVRRVLVIADDGPLSHNTAATEDYNNLLGSYKTSVDSVVSGIIADYNAADQTKKDWLVAAYAVAKAVKKMTDGNGLDMEAKLKIAYMSYRMAEFTWQYNTDRAEKTTKAVECRAKADKLQTVIDQLYSDKVGDIAAQAAQG